MFSLISNYINIKESYVVTLWSKYLSLACTYYDLILSVNYRLQLTAIFNLLSILLGGSQS